MRINNNIKSVLVNMMPSDSTKLFTGRISITNLKGKFIIGYRVKDGILITKLIKTQNQSTTRKYQKGTEKLCEYHQNGDTSCMFTDTELDEVVIMGTSGNNRALDPFVNEGNGDYEYDYTLDWNFGDGTPNGGGSFNTNCPGGKVKNPNTGVCECPDGYIPDFNGNCVLDPCAKIKQENGNPVYYKKINSLKNETSKKKETGYFQNKDGSYTQLTDTNNGHSLDLPINRNTTAGFMHTHLDDFLTGEIDKKTGRPKENRPIKMFSPKDILSYLKIIKNTKFNGIPLSSTYGTMVSSSGTYTLRFTGNPNDVPNSFNFDNKEYEEYIKENGKEVGFLKYLKDKVNLTGLRLFKVKNNSVKEKTLSSDENSTNSIECK